MNSGCKVNAKLPICKLTKAFFSIALGCLLLAQAFCSISIAKHQHNSIISGSYQHQNYQASQHCLAPALSLSRYCSELATASYGNSIVQQQHCVGIAFLAIVKSYSQLSHYLLSLEPEQAVQSCFTFNNGVCNLSHLKYT